MAESRTDISAVSRQAVLSALTAAGDAGLTYIELSALLGIDREQAIGLVGQMLWDGVLVDDTGPFGYAKLHIRPPRVEPEDDEPRPETD